MGQKVFSPFLYVYFQKEFQKIINKPLGVFLIFQVCTYCRIVDCRDYLVIRLYFQQAREIYYDTGILFCCAGREGRYQVLHGCQLLLWAVALRDAPEHGEGGESEAGRTQGIQVGSGAGQLAIDTFTFTQSWCLGTFAFLLELNVSMTFTVKKSFCLGGFESILALW